MSIRSDHIVADVGSRPHIEAMRRDGQRLRQDVDFGRFIARRMSRRQERKRFDRVLARRPRRSRVCGNDARRIEPTR